MAHRDDLGLRPSSAGACVLLVAMACAAGCTRPADFTLGFVGPLSGPMSDLGVSGRNGVTLSVEARNQRGGVRGQAVRLRAEDDAHDPSVAAQVDQALLNAGVFAAVGHMTSSMSLVGAPLFDAEQTVLLSPTTSTNELRGQDDYFLRVFPYSADSSQRLASFVQGRMGHQRAAVLMDLNNRAHTISAADSFEEEFLNRGGETVTRFPFSSGPDLHYLALAKQVATSSASVVFILANARDTAMFCQQLRKLGSTMAKVASDWSASAAVLPLGGRAVEGLLYVHTVDYSDARAPYVRFQRDFEARFGVPADFAAVHSFDAANILLDAAEAVGSNPSAIKDALLRQQGFETLQTHLRFDRFGDVVREHFPIRIFEGRFVRHDQASP